MDRPAAEMAVLDEVEKIQSLHPPFHSAHEGYAMIDEEMHDLRRAVTQTRDRGQMRHECQQIAARAIRFMIDLT